MTCGRPLRGFFRFQRPNTPKSVHGGHGSHTAAGGGRLFTCSGERGLAEGDRGPRVGLSEQARVSGTVRGIGSVEPIDVWRQSGPWQAKVGRWDVVAGHGHRADAANDIDPQAIHEALRSGASGTALPPGSELLLGPLSHFKRAIDPATGQRRFAFLERVKPDLTTVPLLLMHLDAGMFRRQLLPATQPLVRALLRHVNRRLPCNG